MVWKYETAAEILEKEDIHCNLTLLFCKAQTIACADGNTQMISSVVGVIYDGYKKWRGLDDFNAKEDPEVLSVAEIYKYY